MGFSGLTHAWVLGFSSFIESLRDRFNREHRIWTVANVADVTVNFAIYAFLSRLMGTEAFSYLNYYIVNYVATTFASTGPYLVSSVCTWHGKSIVFELIPMRRKWTYLYVWAGFLGTYDAALRAAIAVAIGLAFGASPFAPISSLPMILIAVGDYAFFQGIIQMIFARMAAKSAWIAGAVQGIFMLFNNFISGVYFPITEFGKVSQALYLFASVYPGYLFLNIVRTAALLGNIDYVTLALLFFLGALMLFLLKKMLRGYWNSVVKEDLWEWRP